MEAAAIFAIIAKGLSVIGTLISVGQEAAPAIEALVNLVKGAQAGTVTDDQLAQTEALLDQMIADFNQDI